MPHQCSELPSREQQLLKRAKRMYEDRHSKAALKIIDQILSVPKCAEHGETLCTRALILSTMGKHDEALTEVKRGLCNGLNSSLCWHVYGLVHRAVDDNENAIKAFRQALKIEPKKLQVLRDLALLQMQTRDLEGYCNSRYSILELQPSNRVNWFAYGVARHIFEDYESALRVCKQAMEQFPMDPDSPEKCELVQYMALLMVEGGMFEDALRFLEENSLFAYDRITYFEIKARALEKLGRVDSACEVYKQLRDYYPDNSVYYLAIERCLGIDSDTPSDEVSDKDYALRMAIYEEALEKFPRADHAVIAQMKYCLIVVDDFTVKINSFLRKGVSKGIPATVRQLNVLYLRRNEKSFAPKIAVIHELLNKWLKIIEAGAMPFEVDSDEQSRMLMWIYFFLSDHYDRIGESATALTYIDKAIKQWPGEIDLLSAKAKYLRHMGAMRAAVEQLDEAQKLDTSDRYISSKCAKYMLRANMITEAIALCGRFTREGVPPDQNLREMQCLWFMNECARAHRRLGHVGEALALCHQVEHIFQQFFEDQSDFHTYSMRRVTICSYVNLIRFEDIVREHDYFYVAAACAMKIYLRMHDGTLGFISETASNANGGADARKEARKARRQLMKERERAEAEARETKKPPKTTKRDEDVPEVKMPPIDGDKLAATSTPLENALLFARPILAHGTGNRKALLLAAEVYRRQGKMLAVARLLCAAVDSSDHAYDSARLHVLRMQLMQYRANMENMGTIVDKGKVKSMPEMIKGALDNDIDMMMYVTRSLDAAIRHISPDTLGIFESLGAIKGTNKCFIEHKYNRHSLEAHLAHAEAIVLISHDVSTSAMVRSELIAGAIMPLLERGRLDEFNDINDYRVCKRVAKYVRAYCKEHYAVVLRKMYEKHSHADWFAKQLHQAESGTNGSTINGIKVALNGE